MRTNPKNKLKKVFFNFWKLFTGCTKLNPGADWGQKAISAISFIKSHRDIAEKTPIPLKMHLKNLAILEKASASLKKFSKIVATFIKPQYF
jgi:hypothetical protein